MSTPSPKLSSDAVIGFFCLALAVGWLWYSSKHAAPPPAAPAAAQRAAAAPAPAAALAPAKPLPAAPLSPETRAVLENENFRVVFTSHGGGIAEVDLKQHALEKGTEPVVLNAGPQGTPEPPIFDLDGWEDASRVSYDQTADDARVTYTRTLVNGVRLERAYSLSGPYGVTLVQTLTNPGKAAVDLPAYRLEVGAAAALYHNDASSTLAVNWEGLDDKFGHIPSDAFNASGGFLGFNPRSARGAIASPPERMRWAAVKNRFFTLILAAPAANPIQGVEARPASPLGPHRPPGVAASAAFAPVALAPGEIRAETYTLYAGPKDHGRLVALGRGQERIMEFGMWGWIAVPLAAIMEWMHRGIPNYGWVIVLLTLALKIVFWPLQSASNRSMKKMQALAPKAKELQEKYKEDPQRLQTETMKLYRDYGVNPVGSCLPMLIQIPIFFGFYTMLQSAGQFQHQSWLWVHDLVQPDTVGYLPFLHLAINPLPIISACTQYGLMKMTPQASDNPQMKIMQWMPFVMLIVLYQFAAALSLYWTVNNIVSMVQNYRNLRKPVPALQRVKRKPLPKLGSLRPRGRG